MIYKNIEIHNVAELIEYEGGGIGWRRVPSAVLDDMEAPMADAMVHNNTGVELRFVIKGEKAVLKLESFSADPCAYPTFHIYRGGIQGGWKDAVSSCRTEGTRNEFVISRAENPEHLRIMTEQGDYAFDPEVIRVIFEIGRFKLFSVEGDVAPPTRDMCPKKTLLTYGSSITHGSNALSRSSSWASVLAHNLKMDLRNLGMAGSCAIEPKMADYIASEGEAGKWDVAILELGINVLGWKDEKIVSRVDNILSEVAGRNPEKPIFVISPFYHCGEQFSENDNTANWREKIEQRVKLSAYKNVTYINGLDVLDSSKYMSADEVHPNIYGVARIAEVLSRRIADTLDGEN